VNGVRSAERWLEDRDQIGIGKTILMFRSGGTVEAPVAAAEAKPVLLTACSLVFLFRALAAGMVEGENKLLQNQILRLVGDLIPVGRSRSAAWHQRRRAARELSRRYCCARQNRLRARDCSRSARKAPLPMHSCVLSVFRSIWPGALGGALIVRLVEHEVAHLRRT